MATPPTDVILVELQDGDSLAYNFSYENLRLGAIASALTSANYGYRYADLHQLGQILSGSARPLVIIDAFFRVAPDVMQALKGIRSANPNARVLLFGRAAPTIADNPELHGLVDFFEFLDEPSATLRILGERAISWVATTPIRSSSIDWSDRGVIDVEATRGCQHCCSFCAVDSSGGKGKPALWRARDPKIVAREVYDLIDMTGVTRFQFVDDNLLGSPQHSPTWVTTFARELARARIQIQFSIYARLDRTLISLLPILSEAGLVQIHTGVESGSDSVLRRLRKGLTTAQMERAIGDVRQHRVELVASLITFEQRMTVRELTESLSWICAVDLQRFFSLNTAIPFVGTHLRAEFEECKLPIHSDADTLGFPIASWFQNERVNRVYHYATRWQQETPPQGTWTVESLMRARFRHEERLAVLDEVEPEWLNPLVNYRVKQIRAIQEYLNAIS